MCLRCSGAGYSPQTLSGQFRYFSKSTLGILYSALWLCVKKAHVVFSGFYLSAQDVDISVFTQYVDIGFLLPNTQLGLQNLHEPSSQKF